MWHLRGLGISTDDTATLPGPGESCDAIGLARLVVTYAMAMSAKYVDIGPPRRCEGGYSPKEPG